MRGMQLEWFKSYLTSRFQYDVFNQRMSEFLLALVHLKIHFLAHFFILCINDLFDLSSLCKFFVYMLIIELFL
jgi:uncharacterized membrane protein YcgQ (UPF0703/DUF1980 family)